MSTSNEIEVEGHHLVALALNPEAAGEPIVFLHAFVTSVSLWSQLDMDFLREHGPCYSLSLPGHYPATFPPNFDARLLTADMIARVLTATIHQLLGDNARVTLIGISLGGFAALDIAANSPDSVSRLICISGLAHPKTSPSWLLRWLGWLARQGVVGRAICKSMWKAGRSPRGYSNSWRAMGASPSAFDAYTDQKASLEGMRADFVQLDLDSMIDWMRALYDVDISPILPRITAPTLSLAGDSDPFVPPEQARLIAERVRNAELVLFKGGVHLLPLQRPAEFRRVVEEWLRK